MLLLTLGVAAIAPGAYFGTDPNDLHFGDYGRGDDTFDDDFVVGGHYLYQFLEGTRGGSWGIEMGYRFSPTVEGTFGLTGMGLVGLGFRF